MAKVILSQQLAMFASEKTEIVIEGNSLEEVIQNMAGEFPMLTSKLVEGVRIRPFVRLYINGEFAGNVINKGIPLAVEDELRFVSAIAGG